jgi:hypothetical protein
MCCRGRWEAVESNNLIAGTVSGCDVEAVDLPLQCVWDWSCIYLCNVCGTGVVFTSAMCVGLELIYV